MAARPPPNWCVMAPLALRSSSTPLFSSRTRPAETESGRSVAFGADVVSWTHGPALFTHAARNGGRCSFHIVWLTTVRVGPGHDGAPRSPHFTRELKTRKLPAP